MLGLPGCKKLGSADDAGRVAIVDLDKVAAAVGYKLKDALDQDVKETGAKFDTLIQAARAELEKMRKDFGASPTAEQTKQLQQRQAQLEQGLGAQRDAAISAINAKHAERVVAFRDQVKPIATRLAKAQGATVIITPMPGLFWNDDAADVTDKVIEEINKLRAAGQFNVPPTGAASAAPTAPVAPATP